jgi:hypothetical protein
MGAAELVDQVEAANQRADRAEQEADRLWAKLVELRGVSERIAERAAAEAVELRKRLDEAAGLRAELDARRQWGLRRRLRWALGRRR